MKQAKLLKRVKCKKCEGTGYYSGRYGQTACEECVAGYYSPEKIKLLRSKSVRLLCGKKVIFSAKRQLKLLREYFPNISRKEK